MTKHLTKVATTLLIFLIAKNLAAETTNKIDSLKQLLTTKEPHIQLEVHEQLTVAFLNIDNQQALHYANEGLALSKENEDSLEVIFYDYLGEIHRKLGNYKKALESLSKGLAIKLKTGDQKSMAVSYNKMGKVYLNKSDYSLAIEHFMKALKIMEDINHKEGQSFYLNNIGVVYDFQQMYTEALRFYEASLEIKRELNNEVGIASSLNNIAIVHFNLKDYQKSYEFHQKALDLKIKLKQENKIASSYNNVGYSLLYLNRNEEAIPYLQTALNLRQKQSDRAGIAASWNNLAMAHLNLNNYELAYKYASEGLSMAQEIESMELMKNSYLTLADISEKKTDYKTALDFYQKHTSIKDSLLTSSTSKILAEAEAKYQNEKKEVELKEKALIIQQKDLAIEKESNQRNMISILFVAALITLSMLTLGYFQKRRISILLKAQNLLITKKNRLLSHQNNSINKELEDKNKILSQVYSDKLELELPPELRSLSQREMEVLSILALGWTDQEIADKLFISKATVKSHLRKIYTKLLVKSRTEAVAIAHQYHIIGGSA